MSRNIWLIGAAAGFATVLLFVSSGIATGGSFLSFFVPLPSLIAGLAFGWPVAGIAGLTGALFFFVMTSGVGGLVYTAMIAVPTTLIAYGVGLWRPADVDSRFVDSAVTPPNASGRSDPAVTQWLPKSRILLGLVIMATILAGFMTLSMGTDELKYRAAVFEIMDNVIDTRLEPAFQKKFTIEEKVTMKERAAAMLPGFVAASWMLLMVLNTWLAGRIAAASSQMLRPATRLSTTALPQGIVIGLGAMLLATNIGGVPGRIAMGFVGAALFTLFLIGLAVVHEWSIGNPVRPLILSALYGGVLVLGLFVAPLLAFLGMIEPWLNLRGRAEARRNRNADPPDTA